MQGTIYFNLISMKPSTHPPSVTGFSSTEGSVESDHTYIHLDLVQMGKIIFNACNSLPGKMLIIDLHKVIHRLGVKGRSIILVPWFLPM